MVNSLLKKKNFFNDETFNNLKIRLRRNKIPIKIIKGKKVLDFGCGNGRYSLALRKLGAKQVDGFDFSKKPVNFSKKVNFLNKKNLLIKSKVKYDFVFCNGILSHRKDWKGIIKILSKILKKEGYLWLSLYPKSMYWKSVDKITKSLNKNYKRDFEKLLNLRDWEENRIYFISDLLFSERIYFSKKNIYDHLKKNKFKEINFLKRGIKKDLSEKIYFDPKLKFFFSEGEIRLVAKKL
jgi:SAM-dependent methyltransferase